MGRQRTLLAVILVLLIAAIVVIVRLPVRLGLDLQGGSQLTLQLQTTQEVREITPQQLEAARQVVESRINPQGVSETIVQTIGNDQILVQLPGVNDPKEAEEILGKVARLEFRKQRAGTEGEFLAWSQQREDALAEQARLSKAPQDDQTRQQLVEVQKKLKLREQKIAELFDRTELTGNNLKDAFPEPAGNDNWNIGLRFDARGGELFAQMTKELAGKGRIGIFLDETSISAPTVPAEFAQTGITGGSAVITGRFTSKEAKVLSDQLRGGALPVPVVVVENRTVGATLGRDSVQRSVYAGLGGLVLVSIFMVVYYRLPGLIADVALIFYAILTFACFNLLGVTLTLPGIAGFILSIGMGVDANILIFERTREELRAGKTLYRSVEAGFYRAFSSILDGHITTVIACLALIFFNNGASLVRGFAFTLLVGTVVNLFTAVSCSRTLLLFTLGIPNLRKAEYFCPKLNQSTPTQAQGT